MLILLLSSSFLNYCIFDKVYCLVGNAKVKKIKSYLIFFSMTTIVSLCQPPCGTKRISTTSNPYFFPIPPLFQLQVITIPSFFTILLISFLFPKIKSLINIKFSILYYFTSVLSINLLLV